MLFQRAVLRFLRTKDIRRSASCIASALENTYQLAGWPRDAAKNTQCIASDLDGDSAGGLLCSCMETQPRVNLLIRFGKCAQARGE
jgi:hypothetical protein